MAPKNERREASWNKCKIGESENSTPTMTLYLIFLDSLICNLTKLLVHVNCRCVSATIMKFVGCIPGGRVCYYFFSMRKKLLNFAENGRRQHGMFLHLCVYIVECI